MHRLSYLLKIKITPCRVFGFDLDVDDIGIGCAFATEDTELDQIVFLALGFDVDATFFVVVFHKAFDVALKGVAMHITPEPDVENPTV